MHGTALCSLSVCPVVARARAADGAKPDGGRLRERAGAGSRVRARGLRQAGPPRRGAMAARACGALLCLLLWALATLLAAAPAQAQSFTTGNGNYRLESVDLGIWGALDRSSGSLVSGSFPSRSTCTGTMAACRAPMLPGALRASLRKAPTPMSAYASPPCWPTARPGVGLAAGVSGFRFPRCPGVGAGNGFGQAAARLVRIPAAARRERFQPSTLDKGTFGAGRSWGETLLFPTHANACADQRTASAPSRAGILTWRAAGLLRRQRCGAVRAADAPPAPEPLSARQSIQHYESHSAVPHRHPYGHGRGRHTRRRALSGRAGGLPVAVKSDGYWVRTTSDAVDAVPGRDCNLAVANAAATRLRLLVEGSDRNSSQESRLCLHGLGLGQPPTRATRPQTHPRDPTLLDPR